MEVIYLNPIFVSPSNHKYDCQDYEHIDPHFGRIVKDGGRLVDEDATDNQEAKKYVIRSAGRENLEASDAFFAEFVQEIHRRGMKDVYKRQIKANPVMTKTGETFLIFQS